jgi:hypothetical protein
MTTYTKAEYLALMGFYFPEGERITAARVAWRETRGRPRQINPQPVDGGCKGSGSKHATGLFQIVPACFPDLDENKLLNEPMYSAGAAAGIVAKSGWGPWKIGGNVPPAGLDEYGTEAEWAALDLDAAKGVWSTAVGVTAGPTEALETAGDAVEALGRLGSFLTSWDTWRRALLLAGGAGLVVAAVYLVAEDLGNPLQSITAAAAGAALKIPTE